MPNKKIIIGNWKMNPASLKDAEKLATTVAKGISKIKNTEVVICIPFPYISEIKKVSSKISRKISIGAQNAYEGEVGAFTGEVSPYMLESIGVKYVILGHSERRRMGEDNLKINQKVKFALAAGLVPILCVGENTRDEDHGYFNLIKSQLEECLKGVSKNSISKIIIAYEPVWALSSTVNRHDCTPAEALEMVIFIKKILSDKFGSVTKNIRIIYGGSANEKDAEDFLRNGGVDGLLPGKASLTAEKFLQIINIAENLK